VARKACDIVSAIPRRLILLLASRPGSHARDGKVMSCSSVPRLEVEAESAVVFFYLWLPGNEV
jgi:hypothetical protein